MESKDDGGKDDEFVDLILKLQERFGETCSESTLLERFRETHAKRFDDETKGDEHRLDWTALHEEYLRVWESEVEGYLREEGIDVRDLQDQMDDALSDRYTALFDEHHHHGWVDGMLAALSYEHFYTRMMRQETTTSSEEEEEKRDYKN